VPWKNDREKRRQDTETYGSPEYKRNRAAALRRSGGRCECQGECGQHTGPCPDRTRRVQTDHITPVSQGGGHALKNLRCLCAGPGSCHAAKTAQEGGGYRKPSNGDPQPRRPTTW
jgi:5-methylcytosine-specific restriction endonuclease McrA